MARASGFGEFAWLSGRGDRGNGDQSLAHERERGERFSKKITAMVFLPGEGACD